MRTRKRDTRLSYSDGPNRWSGGRLARSRHDSGRSPGSCSAARRHRGKASATTPAFCSSFWSGRCNPTAARIGSGCCALPYSAPIQRRMMSLPAPATWSSLRPPRRDRWLLGRAAATEAALAEEHRRAVEQMLRERRAARRAVFAARYPQVARSLVKARRATRQFAVRVPPVRQAARFGRRRLIGARHQAIAVQHRVRRRLGQLRSSARSRNGSVEADLEERHATGLRVVADRVVVDVDHSARHDLHTGIQQVVRRTLPLLGA